MSKLSISSGKQSQLWENARGSGLSFPAPALASPLISRDVLRYPRNGQLARRLRKGNKCAQECDGHVPLLLRASFLPRAKFMYTPAFPLPSNVFHAGVSICGDLRYGSWFIEFWPGAAVRLGCTGHQTYMYTCRLTCILYLKFFVSVFSFLPFFLVISNLRRQQRLINNSPFKHWTKREFSLDWTDIWHTLIVMKFFRDLDILHPSMVKCPACKK